MSQKHDIYAFVDPRNKRVFHVGCHLTPKYPGWIPDGDTPGLPLLVKAKCTELDFEYHLVILQTVDSAPLFAWVKWCKRFRRDLLTSDWQAFDRQADALTNSNRVRRAMGLDVPSDAACLAKFYKYDRQNPEVFDKMLRRAQGMKAAGREILGIGLLLEGIRWNGPDTNRTDGFKISNDYQSFYSRKLQMVDPALIGIFAMHSTSMADGLVLEDGRTWLDFAKEHASELRFVETPDVDDDIEWAY
ncbi:MAG: hypothetical protein ABR866_16735 [Candidatus Korobacteraceae bacterium]|jgi:hypothetical protein